MAIGSTLTADIADAPGFAARHPAQVAARVVDTPGTRAHTSAPITDSTVHPVWTQSSDAAEGDHDATPPAGTLRPSESLDADEVHDDATSSSTCLCAGTHLRRIRHQTGAQPPRCRARLPGHSDAARAQSSSAAPASAHVSPLSTTSVAPASR